MRSHNNDKPEAAPVPQPEILQSMAVQESSQGRNHQPGTGNFYTTTSGVPAAPEPAPAPPPPPTLEERVAKLESYIPRIEALIGGP